MSGAVLVGEGVEQPGDELARLPAHGPRARHLELERDQHRRLELGQRQLRGVDPVEQFAGKEPAGVAPRSCSARVLDDPAAELVLGSRGRAGSSTPTPAPPHPVLRTARRTYRPGTPRTLPPLRLPPGHCDATTSLTAPGLSHSSAAGAASTSMLRQRPVPAFRAGVHCPRQADPSEWGRARRRSAAGSPHSVLRVSRVHPSVDAGAICRAGAVRPW